MAWTLQPVVTVGLQILLSIFLGWLLVRLRVLDAEKYMPQVNTLVLWVGVTCLSGYYLGLKLQLDDAEAWRSLAAYILWIAVIQVAILTYCLLVRRYHRRRATRSCSGNDAGINPKENDNELSRTTDGGGSGVGSGVGSGGGSGYPVLREFALLTLILTANNCGMIGLPIMDATFGPPGRRLALLTGIPVMLWVVPFAIFAFEMHKVRENAQEQRRRRSGSGSGSSRMPCGAKLENNGGGGGGSISTHADGPDGVTLRKAFSVALPVGTVSRTGGSGTAAAALTMPRSVRHGASAAVLRRRNTGARGADTGVFLTPSRRSGDGSINHIGSGDSSTTTNAVDTRWRSDQNQSTFVDSRPSEAISARGAAKPRRSMDATSDDGGNVSTGQCPRGIPGPSPGGGAPGGSAGGERIGSTGRTASTGYDEWEMGSGGKSTGAPADLARPGPMLVDAAKAAAG
ncbi:hypothetical protein Vretifemale_5915, partial [Volvox reticuliferus]